MSITELTSQLAAAPGDWDLRRQLVEALVAEGRHEDAAEVVNQVGALPHGAGAWLAAARTSAAVGAFEQAWGLLATALEIAPAYEPALSYRKELSALAPQSPVSLTAEDVDADTDVEAAVPAAKEAVPLVKRSTEAASNGPIPLPKVSFSNTEMEALPEAEDAVRRHRESALRRDKFNALTITVLVHVAIFLALTLVVTQEPPRVPPQIVAAAAPAAQSDNQSIENVKMNRTTTTATTANSAMTSIVT